MPVHLVSQNACNLNCIIYNTVYKFKHMNTDLERERVLEQRYQQFQEWLNKCPLVVTDYQDFTHQFQITFSLEAD